MSIQRLYSLLSNLMFALNLLLTSRLLRLSKDGMILLGRPLEFLEASASGF